MALPQPFSHIHQFNICCKSFEGDRYKEYCFISFLETSLHSDFDRKLNTRHFVYELNEEQAGESFMLLGVLVFDIHTC